MAKKKTVKDEVILPAPISRKELYLNKIATGQEGQGYPTQPVSRIEQYLSYIAAHGSTASHLSYDEDTKILTVNGSLDVHDNGDSTVGRDLYIEDEIIIDGGHKIVDPDGYPVGINAYTTEPTSANTSGDLRIVIVTDVPDPIYQGYIYFQKDTQTGEVTHVYIGG